MSTHIDYSDRIVAFIDCLGFKQKVVESAKNKDLVASLRLMHIIINSGLHAEPQFDFQVLQFSDSLVLSTAPSVEALWFLVQHVRARVSNVLHLGMLFRGGIAIGPVIHQGAMAFGPGYLEAYELKSRIAINPRVILSRRAIQVADRAAAANPGSWQAQYLNRYLRRDDDGLVYVTFFDDPGTDSNQDTLLAHPDSRAEYLGMLSELARRVERQMAAAIDNNRLDIYAKYRWFAIRQNRHVCQVADQTEANVDAALVRLRGLGCWCSWSLALIFHSMLRHNAPLRPPLLGQAELLALTFCCYSHSDAARCSLCTRFMLSRFY